MGHWEQIGVENLKVRERRAKWPRWRRVLHKIVNEAVCAAGWVGLVVVLLWSIGVI